MPATTSRRRTEIAAKVAPGKKPSSSSTGISRRPIANQSKTRKESVESAASTIHTSPRRPSRAAAQTVTTDDLEEINNLLMQEANAREKILSMYSAERSAIKKMLSDADRELWATSLLGQVRQLEAQVATREAAHKEAVANFEAEIKDLTLLVTEQRTENEELRALCEDSRTALLDAKQQIQTPAIGSDRATATPTDTASSPSVPQNIVSSPEPVIVPPVAQSVVPARRAAAPPRAEALAAALAEANAEVARLKSDLRTLRVRRVDEERRVSAALLKLQSDAAAALTALEEAAVSASTHATEALSKDVEEAVLLLQLSTPPGGHVNDERHIVAGRSLVDSTDLIHLRGEPGSSPPRGAFPAPTRSRELPLVVLRCAQEYAEAFQRDVAAATARLVVAMECARSTTLASFSAALDARRAHSNLPRQVRAKLVRECQLLLPAADTHVAVGS